MTTLFLFDTSAMARLAIPAVRNIVATAITDGTAACAITVDLEAAYSGRNAEEIDKILRVRRDSFVHLEVTPEIETRAGEVLAELARQGMHRAAGIVDVLTASIAEHYGAVIVHYDADFEHITAITGQPHRWIVPRGTVN